MSTKKIIVELWQKIDDNQAACLNGGEMKIYISGQVQAAQWAGDNRMQVNFFSPNQASSYYDYYPHKNGYSCYYNHHSY
jgi:hypothetical protein